MTTTSTATGFDGPTFVGETSYGSMIEGRVLRLSEDEAAFEIAGAAEVPRLSDVLTGVRISSNGTEVSSGDAVITAVVNTGSTYLCETRLGRKLRREQQPEIRTVSDTLLERSRISWMNRWQASHRIQRDYKIAVANIENFLATLRHWVEEVERQLPPPEHPDRDAADRDAAAAIVQEVADPLNNLFAEFEKVASGVPEDQVTACSFYVKRLLHPDLLCSPFMYRIFRKPLGYAGDYEMVNMILRDPHEGSTLYARVLNRWMLSQVLAEAHRNRVDYLVTALRQEVNLATRQNRTLRVFNLGCGPAREVSIYATESVPGSRAHFTLVDFNQTTLDYAKQSLSQSPAPRSDAMTVRFIKRSAAQVIRSAGKESEPAYDFVYCAGLFDYLTDEACSLLLRAFYGILAEGGRLLVTNVQAPNPMHGVMTHIFDWHLICRNSSDMHRLWDRADVACDSRVLVDSTGSNVFLEVRKDAESF